MPNRYAIVIAVDGLRASALGAYGNAWHPTPALDRLASESLLFDWMFVDSPELAGFYRAAWLGAPCPPDGVESDWSGESPPDSLPQLLAGAGVAAALTTDDAWVAEQADRLGFSEVRHVEFPTPTPASSIADTELAQLFAIAADQIEAWSSATSDQPDGAVTNKLLWIHARGYRGAWDAPLELRQSLLEEGDPPPSTSPTPPMQVETSDHDELLLHRTAYAAQTIVLDECVAMLMAALESAGVADSTLVVLVGCRGFALGEHGAVGADVRELYGELIHVPLMIRPPDVVPAPPRSTELVQPTDLPPTLLQWFEGAGVENSGSGLLGSGSTAAAPREHVIAITQNGECTLRTKAWLLRLSGETRDEGGNARQRVELFAKPDDRWEANEIADLCAEELAELRAVVEASRAAREASF
jgi:arylsulfatase A-like enzyme